MKEITDFNAFRWESLPPASHFRGMEFFHIRSRRSYRMHTIRVGAGVDDLLAAESICEVELRRGAHYMRRNAPFFSLECILAGELLARQRGRGFLLEPGDIFLMQPEIENEFLCAGPRCHKISVMVVGSLLEPFLKTSKLGETDVISHLDRHHTERLFRQLDEFAESPERNAQLTYELLQYLRTPPRNPELPEKFALLRQALEEHPEYEWSQREMAERCECTPTHLSRAFRKYFGTTPYQLLMELRIDRAKHLLAREELSVKEISALSGYTNALNFSTEFRKRTGMSPRDYRRHISWLN